MLVIWDSEGDEDAFIEMRSNKNLLDVTAADVNEMQEDSNGKSGRFQLLLFCTCDLLCEQILSSL